MPVGFFYCLIIWSFQEKSVILQMQLHKMKI